MDRLYIFLTIQKYISGIMLKHCPMDLTELTISVWGYLFKTNYIPEDGRDIEIGFKNDEDFPKDLRSQMLYPLLV